MTEDHRSGAPDFVIRGTRWVCWVTDAGQSYQWRTSCGLSAGRLGPHWWARCGDRSAGDKYPTPRAAMDAAMFRKARAA